MLAPKRQILFLMKKKSTNSENVYCTVVVFSIKSNPNQTPGQNSKTVYSFQYTLRLPYLRHHPLVSILCSHDTCEAGIHVLPVSQGFLSYWEATVYATLSGMTCHLRNVVRDHSSEQVRFYGLKYQRPQKQNRTK